MQTGQNDKLRNKAGSTMLQLTSITETVEVNKQDFLQVFQGSGIGKIEDRNIATYPDVKHFYFEMGMCENWRHKNKWRKNSDRASEIPQDKLRVTDQKRVNLD